MFPPAGKAAEAEAKAEAEAEAEALAEAQAEAEAALSRRGNRKTLITLQWFRDLADLAPNPDPSFSILNKEFQVLFDWIL